MVYDLDGDGKAEVACKTADGTKDGTGKVIGDAGADYRNSTGYILSGPEYLTVFQGSTGKALYTGNYEPARGDVSGWGDSYGNRVDRFLACVAYLDGVHPSLVMCRGYYTRTVLAAYDWNGSALSRRWLFDSNSSGNSKYAGQGNHNLSVADVDGDGKDEIIYGACAIDDNGKGLYSTGLMHGDALHVGDLDPSHPGLEVWSCHEDSKDNGGIGASFRDAGTGKVLWSYAASKDVGRACSADVTASSPGEEVWVSNNALYSCKGQIINNSTGPVNFAIWWDGDELRELLNDISITKYGGGTLLTANGCSSNNGTKATPCLQADIFGDWREEAIWRTSDNGYLNIYTTTDLTNRRIYTLMHDPVYRLGVAWQNVAYNQPPHTGFFLGAGMAEPPQPSIIMAGHAQEFKRGDINSDGVINALDFALLKKYLLTGDGTVNAIDLARLKSYLLGNILSL
jgi:rhamnogalacturonan endolyase